MRIKFGLDGYRFIGIFYDTVNDEFNCVLRKGLKLHDLILFFQPYPQIDGVRNYIDSLYFCNMVDYG
jgi:hypothetical protein